jgi:nicotinate-nucleotide adenylyltransferase
LVCAQEAAWQLGLDRVLLMPVGQAPHKSLADDPGADARLEMCTLAIAGGWHLEASGLEAERAGPSYTYETLERLSEEQPNGELVFVLGADQAAELPGWRRPERVLELARLGIAERSGVDRGRVKTALDRLGAAERGEFFYMPEIDVSSTMVRQRVKAGQPLRYLVPDAVIELIERKRLYR